MQSGILKMSAALHVCCDTAVTWGFQGLDYITSVCTPLGLLLQLASSMNLEERWGQSTAPLTFLRNSEYYVFDGINKNNTNESERNCV